MSEIGNIQIARKLWRQTRPGGRHDGIRAPPVRACHPVGYHCACRGEPESHGRIPRGDLGLRLVAIDGGRSGAMVMDW